MILEDKLYLNQTNKKIFITRLETIAKLLGIKPEWLMVVMYHESKLNPRAINSIYAVGLLQFLPSTLEGLGYHWTKVVAMSHVEQLEVVYKYLKPFAGKINTIYDLVFAVFFPLAIGKPDSFTLETKNLSAELIAKQNKGFDLNSNKRISVGEVKKYYYNYIVEKLNLDPTDLDLKKKRFDIFKNIIWNYFIEFFNKSFYR